MGDIENSISAYTAKDLVGDRVVQVAPGATLHEIASVLNEAGIGAVGVGDGDVPIGIISERDLVRAVAERRDPETTTAAELYRSPLNWVGPDSALVDVAIEMMSTWSRHVLVGDGRQLVGILSVRDLLGVMAAADIDTDET